LDPRLLNQTVVASDFRAPISHQWNIAYQRKIASHWSMEAAWVANRTSSILRSANGNPNNIRGGYKLDGTALNSWQDIFFIAPMAVAAMTGEGAVDQQWLNSIYSRVYQSHNTGDYYGDAVTLQSLLAVTGNFWDPMAVLQAPQVPGDFDDDGDVDADDLSRWRSSFGMNNQADADGDGDSDGEDFLLWQRSFQPAIAATAVPEPTVATLLMGGLVAGAATFARRRIR